MITKLDYDFVVAGAGYSGALFSLCLSKLGYSVGLFESNSIPKFLIGEGTTPEQNRLHKQISKTFKIPELEILSSYTKLVSSGVPISCWPKEAFYFVEDNIGQSKSLEPKELLFQTAPWPHGPDYHAYRSDLDLYIVNLAKKYGCSLHIRENILSIDTSPTNHVIINYNNFKGKNKLKCSYFIDASGVKSKLTLQLTELLKKPNIPFNSRSIYSHFLNVKLPEDSFASEWDKLSIPRGNSTVHHINKNGWAWVIPFNNGITSVGIVEKIHTEKKRIQYPSTYFYSFLKKMPFLENSMSDAVAIQPFISTETMQFRVKHIVGKRWIILPIASGFLDPLFSTGMALGTQAVWRFIVKLKNIKYKFNDLDDIFYNEEIWFHNEQDILGKLIGAHYNTFHDLNLFSEVFRLHREAAYLGGISQDEIYNYSRRDILGTESHHFSNLIDKIYNATCNNLSEQCLRTTYENYDPFKFIHSNLDTPEKTNIFLNTGIPLLQWKLKVIFNKKNNTITLYKFMYRILIRLLMNIFKKEYPVLPNTILKRSVIFRGIFSIIKIKYLHNK